MERLTSAKVVRKVVWLLFLALGLSLVVYVSSAVADCPDADIDCSLSCKGPDIGTFKVGRCFSLFTDPPCTICHSNTEHRVGWAKKCREQFAPDHNLTDIYTCYKPDGNGTKMDCFDSTGKWCGSYGGQ